MSMFKNKIAIVTGAASGIGAAKARALRNAVASEAYARQLHQARLEEART